MVVQDTPLSVVYFNPVPAATSSPATPSTVFAVAAQSVPVYLS